MGKGAIFLVPEIALTPQTSPTFARTLASKSRCFTAGFRPGERYDEWWRIFRRRSLHRRRSPLGRVCPRATLGHDHPGRRARDFVQAGGEPPLPRPGRRLGAGPRGRGALRSWAQPRRPSRCGPLPTRAEYAFVSLPSRVHARPLPRVETVDMREELLAGNRSMFSRLLREKMEAALLRGEQALLFMNRRGLASFVLCRECGYVPRCDSCEVSLTLHLPATLRCHYCDATQRLPAACPQCGGTYLRPFGGGTQRIEQEVVRLFPKARPVRMDLDTTSRKGAHARIIDAFAEGRYNVLIGTQMVAKGLHFPGVTLVGVVSADVGAPFARLPGGGAHLPNSCPGRRDERDGETGGRSGDPNLRAGSLCVAKAAAHDYEGFLSGGIGVSPAGRVSPLFRAGPLPVVR